MQCSIILDSEDSEEESYENKGFGMKAIQTYNKDKQAIERQSIKGQEIKYGKQLSNEQREQLFSLLHNYQDAFAMDPKMLGITNKTYHAIDTGNENPIHTPPYRQPPFKRRITMN